MCSEVSADEADEFIFGYTCVQRCHRQRYPQPRTDLPAMGAGKGLTIRAVRPVITSGIDPPSLVVRTISTARNVRTIRLPI